MEVQVVDAEFDSFDTELIVVGMFTPPELSSRLKKVDEKLYGAVSRVLKRKEFEGEYGQNRLISTLDKIPAKNILLLGLGKKEDADLELLRKAAGLSAKIVRDFCGVVDYSSVLHELDISGTTRQQRAQAVAEGSVLGTYQFLKFRTVDREKIKSVKRVTLVGNDVAAEVRKGVIIAECACLVRDLANEPASNRHPEELADVAKTQEKLGVKVTVYDKKGIEKLGLKALLAVNRGSVHEPRFVVMEYKGGGKKVAIVGKGITFDSGGLDIKPDEGLLTMKHDLCGAAAVIASVRAAALLKLKINLIGVFAATENMPGMDAYKPGDIIVGYNGKTMEIANTDAEGRVVLSDALAYTEKNFKPDCMIDLATLTGACVVALGNVCAGIIGTDESLIKRLIDAGNATGERVWQLPFFREYHEQIKSDFADVRNLGIMRREAGAITAAAFLAAFVDKVPWAHLDIAGTSWSDQEIDYTKKGGTGFGVRLLVHFLENL